MIDIQETFGPTIEGEGALVGSPVIYIRTGPGKTQQQIAVTDLIAEVVSRSQHRPYLVTVTGGEPCLYAEVGDLIAELHKHNHMVKVETRGTVIATWLDQVDVLSISPDLYAPDRDILQTLLQTQAKSIYLKAGILTEDDLECVQHLIDAFPSVPLYLFPKHDEHLEDLTATTQHLLQQYRWLTREILHRNWTHVQAFPPAHVLLWGNTSGV